jgi:hypothetical protein
MECTGHEVSIFRGQIIYRNLELIPSELLAKAWRVDGWAHDDYSIPRFAPASVPGGSVLTCDHLGSPEEAYEDLTRVGSKMCCESIRRSRGS